MTEVLEAQVGEEVRRWMPYPAYKNSSVEWLGEIPEHWDVLKLKYAAPLSSARLDSKPQDLPYVGLENIEPATGRLLMGQPLENVDSTVGIFHEGDVLLGKLRPYLAKVHLARFDGCCTTEIVPLKPSGAVVPKFLFYALLSPGFVRWMNTWAYGTKMPRVSPERIAVSPIVVPSLREQQAVADFLDRETAKIDALIAKKRALLTLFAEREQARVLQSVGDWRRMASKSLRQFGTRVVTGPFGTHLSASEYIEGGTPVINPTHIKRGRLSPDPKTTVSADVARRLERHRLSRGDVIMGRKGDVGRAAIIPAQADGWICGSDSIAIRTNPNHLLPDYLSVLLQLSLYRQQLQAGSTGIAVAGVNEPALLTFRIPALDIAEQQKAVKQAVEFMHEYEEMSELLTMQVDLLGEQRAALISAAVTGKIDLREAA